MKFGDKLQLLSIPEWRTHNFDYSGIEKLISNLEESCSSKQLAQLRFQFEANFASINIFVDTTHSDIADRINALESVRADLAATIDHANYQLNHVLVTLDGILYHALRISPLLKDLGRFILVQNIAIQKLFTKLSATTMATGTAAPDLDGLVEDLTRTLHDPRPSPQTSLFVNADLVSTANKLTSLLHDIKSQQQALVRPRSVSSASPTRIGSESSISSIQNMRQSTYFDWQALLKKNFTVALLFADSSTTLSDLVLDLNVYLNLDTASEQALQTQLVSYTYLVSVHDASTVEEPGYVVSHIGGKESLVVAYTGGLRKYAYCLLPNDIVEHLLQHLARPLDVSHRELERLLRESENTSHLTQLTLETLLNQRAKPAMRRVFSRMRYYIDLHSPLVASTKTDTGAADPAEDAMFLDVPPQSRRNAGNGASHPSVSSLYGTRGHLMPDRTENGYLVSLDHDIYCTSDAAFVKTVRVDPKLLQATWDKFPHNYISVHSNDLHLSHFCDSLHTEINADTGHITSSFAPATLRALPAEIASLILRTPSLHIFQLFNMYLYCASCYLNVVPKSQYLFNHYTYMLGLNLLALHENVEQVCTQRESDAVVMRKTSRRVLQRQRSVQLASGMRWKDITSFTHALEDNCRQLDTDHGHLPTNDHASAYSESPLAGDSTIFSNPRFNMGPEMTYADFLDQSGHPWYPGERTRLTVGLLIHQYIKSKHQPGRMSLVATGPSYGSMGVTGKSREPYYVHEYMREYDETLACMYFSAMVVAVFASGVDVALAYLLSLASELDYRLDVLDEAWFMIGWVVGMLLSLGFYVCGLTLLGKRFTVPPKTHRIGMYTGLVVITLSLVILILFLIQGIQKWS